MLIEVISEANPTEALGTTGVNVNPCWCGFLEQDIIDSFQVRQVKDIDLSRLKVREVDGRSRGQQYIVK